MADGMTTRPASWADQREHRLKNGLPYEWQLWEIRPPCSRYDDIVDDASERVRFTCGLALGMLENSKARLVASMIARLHDHKGTLYVVRWRSAPPLTKDIEAAFEAAWPDDDVRFVSIASPEWQRVWAAHCFGSDWATDW
jgi:hypothetical protein